MKEPIQNVMRQGGKALKLSELVRNEIGLVNDIRPARPQPKKKPAKLGGSKARKILKGQR